MTMQSEKARSMMHRVILPKLPIAPPVRPDREEAEQDDSHPSQKQEPESEPLASVLSRLGKTLTTRNSTASTGKPNGQSSVTTISGPKPAPLTAAGEHLGAHGVAKRWSSKPPLDPHGKLLALVAGLRGRKPQLYRWLDDPRKRRRWKMAACPNGLGEGMTRTIAAPPSGSYREVLAVHDLAAMALAERITDAELGQFLAGCYATQKGNADAPAEAGMHAWRIGLDGLPLFAIRAAFTDWIQREQWTPQPAAIREVAERKAMRATGWRDDCRALLVGGYQ